MKLSEISMCSRKKLAETLNYSINIYNRVIVVNITHLLSIEGLNTVYTIEPCDQVSIDMLVKVHLAPVWFLDN
jgi:hypothetical protein